MHDEMRVMYPVASDTLTEMGIDNLPPDVICGVVFTANDLDRGFQRWRNLFESTDPYTHEWTEPLIANAEALLSEARRRLEASTENASVLRQRSLQYVNKITELEGVIRGFETEKDAWRTDKGVLETLSTSRDAEIGRLKGQIAELQQTIQRYQRKYKIDENRSFFKRIWDWLGGKL